MITCTRRIQFCAGHRVHLHESKCRNFHGHNYVVFVEAVAPELDAVGRVIDFSVLKDKIGGWIDANWDHGFLYWRDDYEAKVALAHVGQQKVYVMPTNPTAENMAAYLLHTVCPMALRGTGVTVRRVTVGETENCYAEAVAHEPSGAQVMPPPAREEPEEEEESGFQVRKRFSDRFMVQAKKIVRELGRTPMDVLDGTPEQDLYYATDLYIPCCDGGVGVRVRRGGKLVQSTDFTVRATIVSGGKTELHKLKDGHCQFYLYSWADRANRHIERWMFLDMERMRQSELLQHPRQGRITQPDSTWVYWTFEDLDRNGVVLATSWGEQKKLW